MEDLLFHFPIRYEDRRRFTPIAELREGMRTAVSGTIAVAGLRRARRMTLYEVRLEDATGRLKALWFNQPFLADVLTRGRRVILYGTVERDTHGGARLMMSSPQHEPVADDDAPGVHMGRVAPIYEKAGGLSGQVLRRVLAHLAEQLPDDLPDPLPAAVRARLGVTSRVDALRGIHKPDEHADVAELNRARGPAYERLILEELFLFQLGLARRRQGLKERRKTAAFVVNDRVRDAVKRILPFRLTEAQKRVLREIAADLTSPHPMHRLVQGDVGSGKTMIALLAMVIAVESGYQAAFMAPTEILAEQHFLTFRRLLARCPYAVELVTAGAQGKRSDRAAVRARLADGTTQIAVGTHALIQPEVALRAAGARHRGRAAPLRRPAARRAGSQGPRRRGRAGADGDAHPALAGAHRVRRPGPLGGGRAPARPHAHRDAPCSPRPTGARRSSACGRRSRAAARPTWCTRWSRNRRSWRTCARPRRWPPSGRARCPPRGSGCCTGA